MSIYSSSIHNIYTIFKTPRWWSRRTCAQLLLQELQNCNLLLSNSQMLDPTKKKDTPYPRAKEKPQQDDQRGKITFRIKPHTCQRHTEGSNKPCAHQDPETPQRLSQNCV